MRLNHRKVDIQLKFRNRYQYQVRAKNERARVTLESSDQQPTTMALGLKVLRTSDFYPVY